jgi:hypothetical protein
MASTKPYINQRRWRIIADKIHDEWCIHNGYPLKPQASSTKLKKQRAASVKLRAASFKLQAASSKLLDSISVIKIREARSEGLNSYQN